MKNLSIEQKVTQSYKIIEDLLINQISIVGNYVTVFTLSNNYVDMWNILEVDSLTEAEKIFDKIETNKKFNNKVINYNKQLYLDITIGVAL